MQRVFYFYSTQISGGGYISGKEMGWGAGAKGVDIAPSYRYLVPAALNWAKKVHLAEGEGFELVPVKSPKSDEELKALGYAYTVWDEHLPKEFFRGVCPIQNDPEAEALYWAKYAPAWEVRRKNLTPEQVAFEDAAYGLLGDLERNDSRLNPDYGALFKDGIVTVFAGIDVFTYTGSNIDALAVKLDIFAKTSAKKEEEYKAAAADILRLLEDNGFKPEYDMLERFGVVCGKYNANKIYLGAFPPIVEIEPKIKSFIEAENAKLLAAEAKQKAAEKRFNEIVESGFIAELSTGEKLQLVGNILKVPNWATPHLIGKGGEKIKRVQAALGKRITIVGFEAPRPKKEGASWLI